MNKLTEKQKRELLLLLVRSGLDLIVFFGIGLRLYSAIGVVFGLIAIGFYRPWFDPMYEEQATKLRIVRAWSRRFVYGLYFGPSWQ